MNRAERRRRGRRGGNYLGRVVALGRTLAQSRGAGVYHVLVWHEWTCPRPDGGRCRCTPDVELVGGPDGGGGGGGRGGEQ